jgi:glutamate N-acetyltransferase/amino-acid N-acetyltransferase
MISPRMATMLAYVTLDADVEPQELFRITRAASDASFNRITVDGQMSPSDTLIVLSSGAGPRLRGGEAAALASAVAAVCRWLAVQMVKDGEGAEHVMRVLVRGARDAVEAEAVARAIANSPLVKAAAFGRDPNWGRIRQAVGQALAGADGPATRLEILFDGVPADHPHAVEVLAREEYDLEVRLGRGSAEAAVWASDLTHGYVALNAEYHT